MRLFHRPWLALFLLCCGPIAAADFRADAQKSYDKMALGVEKRDQRVVEKALGSFTTKDFSFTDPFGSKHPAPGYAMLLIQLALPNGKETKRFRIVGVKVVGKVATVNIRSEAPGVVRTTTDTWVQQGKIWKLKAVRYTAPAASLGIGS